jgi:predicted alpha/beta-fold hydrolase
VCNAVSTACVQHDASVCLKWLMCRICFTQLLLNCYHHPLQLRPLTINRGGIIALNYIARAGKQCPLSSCITIAGSFDTRTNMSFWHSRLVWQPLLGLCLKENFVMPHVHKLKARGMDAASLAGLKDVIHFDTHMVAKYHRCVL